MEDQIRAPALTSPVPGRAPGAGGWIVSPLFDLLFLANLGWLLAFLPGFITPEGTIHLQFWQVYFLTTPHRWITLALVAVDPDRRERRTWLFVALAVLAGGAVWGVRWWRESFECLILVDFIWNAWHFASQHHGVLRIYGRKVGGGWPAVERYGVRLFVLYVILRIPAWTWLESDLPAVHAVLPTIDLAMLAVPAGLLATAWWLRAPHSGPKLIYLASVCCLYSSLLLALHAGNAVLVLSLAAAMSAFHAVEYLAIVTHYARQRGKTGTAGLFQVMARRWLGVLAAFVVVLGLSAFLIEQNLQELWLGLNLWAAFLHYAYDGMIWKLRRPATAQALGIDGPVPAAVMPGVAAPAAVEVAS